MSSVRASRADWHTRSTAGEIVVTIDASLCQTYSGELPTRCGGKEVAVGCTNMIRRSDARASPEDHLTGHEFAVVFAQCTWERFVSGIARVGACRPFPAVAKQLLDARGPTRRCWMQPACIEWIPLQRLLARDVFPFSLCRKSTAAPPGKGIGLIETDVADRRIKQIRKPM